ncbi:GlsB/YeaQ/YmgE family stress response membrane protein [Caulobacter segnis]|uniref:GlsB/YeaQ/YmgE family stress response membrane protein n=1 Tax=Caulobacter segnis TaxID=88688 RepID=UPI002859CA2D|nr:GlsB/YeaQ/YmgE family stress response membrane protein [Caulobacter segnis]MDR6625915.1 putative membrane protein YeaQ/YmgE (transglycosylase-associated protein family) [Caulobacter segnis]
MSGTGVFAAAMVGIIAGWIADHVLDRRHSLFIKLLVGVVGAFIGAFTATRIDLPIDGLVGEFTVSIVGAVLFLALLGLIRRPA